MGEVVDRRGWNAHQAVNAGHAVDGEFRDALPLGNAEDRASRGLSNGVNDLVDCQRRGIGELVAFRFAARAEEIDGIDDEVARDDVEVILRRPADHREKGETRLTQDPLHDVVRSVEFLCRAGLTVTHDH